MRARPGGLFSAFAVFLLLSSCGGGDSGTSMSNVAVKTASLNGAQETPAVTTAATGLAVFTIDMNSGAIQGSVTTSNIDGIVAHIHTVTGGPANWTMPPTVLTAAQLTALGAGNLYANVHSAANPGGEIRGQVYVPVRMANLTGSQETPPNASTGSGTGTFIVNPFTRAV